MQHINPPLKKHSLTFWLIVLLLNVCMANAASLSQSPTNSMLTIIVANNTTGLLDKTMVGFNPLSTDTFNPVYDANKLPGLANRQTLYTWNSGQWMSINVLPNEATVDTVSMGMDPGSDATFTMSFTGLGSFDSTAYIYLEDKKLHIWFNLRKGNYTFSSVTTDDWNRFVLHFTPPVLISGIDTNCSSTPTVNIQQPGMAWWTYTLTDTNNAVISTGTVNQNQTANVQVAPGTYNLTFTDSNNYSASKTINVSAPVPVTAIGFAVSDTNLKVLQPIMLTVALTGNDSTIGTTIYQWNFGNGTTGTGGDTTISYTKPGDYNLGLTVSNQSGCTATQTQKITITQDQATALADITSTTDPTIWSNGNKLYVDFSAMQMVDATVTVYNVLGQEISNERFTNNGIYQKQMDNISASYLIVKVLNNHITTAKKVFIASK